MAGGIDWFRWHHGTVTDQKFPLVARRAGATVAEVIAVWACLLEAASMNTEERGWLGGSGVDFEAMDCALGMEEGRSEAIFAAMQARDLVDQELQITAWPRRQPKREREDDNSTERSRACRARQRQATPSNANDSQQEPSGATQRTETPRGEESREVSSSLRSEEKRATRLPSDWVLPPEWAEWAKTERPDLDPTVTACKFADYWQAKAGKDGRKLDWLKTWRNWVREERRQPLPARVGNSGEPAWRREQRDRMAQLAPGVAARHNDRETIDVDARTVG